MPGERFTLDRLKRRLFPHRHPKELNPAVNFPLRAIFIAIPKTGTTSIRDQISPPGPYLVPADHLNLMQVRDALYPHLLVQALNRNRGFPTEGVPSDADVRAKARATFEGFFKFSSVRNPWARAVSLYYRGEGVQVPTEEMSFAAFCERHVYASDTCRKPTLHRNQLDWIVDETGEIAVDCVNKNEELDRGFDEVRERTGGRIDLAALRRNVNARSKSESYRELYDDATRALIARHFEKDIDTFKYVF